MQRDRRLQGPCGNLVVVADVLLRGIAPRVLRAALRRPAVDVDLRSMSQSPAQTPLSIASLEKGSGTKADKRGTTVIQIELWLMVVMAPLGIAYWEPTSLEIS